MSIKTIERVNDSHVSYLVQFNFLLIEYFTQIKIIIEADGKTSHSLYGFHDKASLQPFLIILFHIIRTSFPHRLEL